MAVRFFRTYKTIPYLGGDEEVTNVYMYSDFSDGGAGTDTPGDIRDTEGEILDAERSFHCNDVSFIRVESGLVRPPRGSEKYPVPGEVDYDRTYPEDTLGLVLGAVNTFPEVVVMAQKRIGRRSWLRKYWHILAYSTNENAPGRYDYLFSDSTVNLVQAGIDAIKTTSLTAEGGGHELCNSRGDSGGDRGDWVVDDRIRFHDMKY